MGCVIMSGSDPLRDVARNYLEAAASLDSDALADAYGGAIASLDEDKACAFKVAIQGVAMADFIDPAIESKALNALEDMREGITSCTLQSEKQWVQDFKLGAPGLD